MPPKSPAQQQKPTSKPKGIKQAEWKRLQKLLVFENQARQDGFSLIAGVDEAGRGPLAGPVVAAACIIPPEFYLVGINDSKKLSAEQREDLYGQIVGSSQIQFGIGIVCNHKIDKINILQASIEAMLIAVGQLGVVPDMMFVDGLRLPHPTIPCQKIIHGDALSHSIAAASVIAKVTRDRIMVEYHKQWPHYGFNRHKGYSTAEHLDNLKQHGPCPIHRMSFEPLSANREGQLEFQFS